MMWRRMRWYPAHLRDFGTTVKALSAETRISPPAYSLYAFVAKAACRAEAACIAKAACAAARRAMGTRNGEQDT
jgi:hypothetical protein